MLARSGSCKYLRLCLLLFVLLTVLLGSGLASRCIFGTTAFKRIYSDEHARLTSSACSFPLLSNSIKRGSESKCTEKFLCLNPLSPSNLNKLSCNSVKNGERRLSGGSAKRLRNKTHSLMTYLREAAKKFFFIGPATKRGGGVRAWPSRKNYFFKALKINFSKKMRGFSGWATKKRTFFAAFITNHRCHSNRKHQFLTSEKICRNVYSYICIIHVCFFSVCI